MKLAIFDVDGTLVDSRAMITACLTTAFTATGVTPPDRQRFISIVGLSLHNAMRALVPHEEESQIDHLVTAYKQAFWDLRTANTHPEDLFAGAHELLAKLHARDDVLLGIATGKSRRGVAHLIESLELQDWFVTIQTADEHPSKPHPSMIVQALADTGLEPSAAIMIGDTSFDIEMARAAGAGAAGVAWGNHDVATLQRAGAHTIANDFNQLESHLESLWQERMR